MALFDEDVAWKRCSRMWQKVGRELEVAAYQAAEQGLAGRAVDLACAAEAAFWQATGSSDIVPLREFRSTHPTSASPDGAGSDGQAAKVIASSEGFK